MHDLDFESFATLFLVFVALGLRSDDKRKRIDECVIMPRSCGFVCERRKEKKEIERVYHPLR